MIIKQGHWIVNDSTGEVICSTIPRFDKYTTKEHFAKDTELDYIDCQCAKELDADKLVKYLSTRLTVAEQKFDGHRGKLHITKSGNRLFSRNVSKIGWHSENTDQVPHIRDAKIDEFFYDTIIDGEILLPVEDCDCRAVQGVTGALPSTAIDRQLEVGFAFLNAFDIIKYNGLDVTSLPYWKRKILLFHVVKGFDSEYIKFCDVYATKENYDSLVNMMEALDSNLCTGKLYHELALEMHQFIHQLPNTYDDLFSEFLQKGLEGLIIKDISCRYQQTKNDNFVKMKAHLTFDCVITGYDDPEKMYDGKTLSEGGKWDYWIDEKNKVVVDTLTLSEADDRDLLPVTKFYAKDWIGAIRFGVWKDGKLLEVGRTSGLDEATRKLISENKEDYLGQVIEVEAQRIIDMETGSLQHPRYYRMREDKNSEQCTFDDHIRK